MQGDLYITGDPEADGLLTHDPLALLIGMLLDQQVPMEWAFSRRSRCGSASAARSTPPRIAAMPLEELEVVVPGPAGPPPLPGVDGQAHPRSSASTSSTHYGGDADAVWADVDAGDELYARLQALPGYGEREGEDLHRPPRQAVRHQPRRAGRRRRHRSPTSTRRSVADVDSPRRPPRRCASSRRPRRRRARARTRPDGSPRGLRTAALPIRFALAVEPAEQDRHGPGVVAELVTGAGDDPQLGRRRGRRRAPGRRRPARRRRRSRAPRAAAEGGAGARRRRRGASRSSRAQASMTAGKPGRVIDPDLAGVLEQPARVGRPVVEVGRRGQGGDAADPWCRPRRRRWPARRPCRTRRATRRTTSLGAGCVTAAWQVVEPARRARSRPRTRRRRGTAAPARSSRARRRCGRPAREGPARPTGARRCRREAVGEHDRGRRRCRRRAAAGGRGGAGEQVRRPDGKRCSTARCRRCSASLGAAQHRQVW